MEQENKKEKDENIPEASTKSQSSENKNQKSLKAKSKIAKKSTASETKKGKSTLQLRRRNRKKKNSVSEGNIESSNNEEQDAKKLTSKEESQQKNATNKERIEKNEEKAGGSYKSQKKQRTEKKHGGSEEQDVKKLTLKEESQQKNATNKERIEKNEEKACGSYKSQKRQRTEKKHGGSEEQDAKKLTSKEESQQKNATNKERIEKNEEKTGGSYKSQKRQRTEKKHGGSEEQDAKKLTPKEESQQKNATNKERIEKNEEKTGGSYKSQMRQRTEKKHGGSEKSLRNQKNKEKRDGIVKSQNEKKRENLGGLIFMCSAKTKPDCFRYRVMGVTMGKKDLMLSVKPGLKLFLYDFDLKLMYGIYQASSSGGVKLEPNAFAGAFPVQVRFSVHTDCYPLPENIFKKAIKENYNERHKFKTELTGRQVRKLMELFRPATLHSTAPPIHSPPTATIRDREVYEGVRESRLHSSRETFARDPYVNGDARNYPVLSHERDRRIGYGEVASAHRDEVSCALYLTEKEYRAYGLQGEKKNLTPPHHMVPALDTFKRGHEREHLFRHPYPVHRDTVPGPRESVRVDPLYLTEREYQTYNVGARRELPSPVLPAAATASASTAGAAPLDTYTRDQYYNYYYGASSVDLYLPPPRREEVSSGSYYVGGRRETYAIETDQVDRADRLYSTYGADALSNSNWIHHYQGPKSEAAPAPAPAPVSSRYSFAGPSMSYR